MSQTWMYPYGSGSSTYSKDLLGYIIISMKDGSEIYGKIKDSDDYDAIQLSNLFEIEHNAIPRKQDVSDLPKDPLHDFIVIRCNEDELKWNRTSRRVMTCLVKATSNLMQHWFGRSLDRHDEDWYEAYADKVSTHGCKEPWTLTVTHQMVAPYELGVSRVFVPRGTNPNKEMHTWMARLGVNPSAACDYSTTNEEYFSNLGCDQATIDAMPHGDERKGKQEMHDMLADMFRFEYVDQPTGPCILLSAGLSAGYQTGGGWSSSTGYNVQSYGTSTTNTHNGGAFYSGPRAGNSSTWKMAVALDWRKNLKYDEHTAPLDPYKVDNGYLTPKLDSLIIVEQDDKFYDIWKVGNHLANQRRKAEAEKKAKKQAALRPKFEGIRALAREFNINNKEAKAVWETFDGDMKSARAFLKTGEGLEGRETSGLAPHLTSDDPAGETQEVMVIPASDTGGFGDDDLCPACNQTLATAFTQNGENHCGWCNTTLGPHTVVMGPSDPPRIQKSL